MNRVFSLLFIACALRPIVGAAELPKAGSYTAGAQIPYGNIDHDSFNSDPDGTGR